MSVNRQRQLQQELRRQFEALARPCHADLYRSALRMTRDPDRAADLTQEAFLRAFEKFYQFAEGTNFRAWVSKIMVNLHIAAYRKRRHAPAQVAWQYLSLPDEHRLAAAGNGQVNPEALYLAKAPIERLRWAVGNLPEPFRAAVQLADLEDLTYDEISRKLAIPIGTVRSRIARGRKLVMDALRPEAEAE